MKCVRTLDCLLDVVFIIDSSASIRDTNVKGGMDNWGLVIDFVDSVVESFNVGPELTHVAAVAFGNVLNFIILAME